MRLAPKHLRAKLLGVTLISTLTVIAVFFCRNTNNREEDHSYLLQHVNRLIESGHGKFATQGQACRVPFLDVNSSEILSLLKEGPKLSCSKNPDWVEVIGSTVKIAEWAKLKYGNVECSFTEVIRKSDYDQYYGIRTTTHTEFNLETSDISKVECVAANGERWKKIVMGIRFDQELFDRITWANVPQNALRLNVLIFGMDSLSHNMWKRKLPKTYKYAVKDLKGIALNSYNIVGDGTPQALIPILTGRTELELPDTRKRMTHANYVNVYPFIWNDFQKHGYVTAWGEDLSKVGTFTYRMKGFKEQPVDHYMRTFYMEATPDFSYHEPYCYGGISRFRIMLDFIRNVYDLYREGPKFTFVFHSEYSHDHPEMVGRADDEILKWLEEFNAKGFFNNTLLILMSDHGSRYSDIRNTLQGKQEERLPGFIFVFPPWFEKKYPEAISNFRINANRLTTPFDIYETLKSVLHYSGAGKGNVLNRGISLFKEIPQSRTCQHASIEPHWCSCLEWENISATSPEVIEAVEHLIKFINSYTAKYRDLCAELSLVNVIWSARLLPNKYLLRFRKSIDVDGFVSDLSDSTKIKYETYQVKVSLRPGNMLFEASVRYSPEDEEYSVSLSEISRTNEYHHMTHCIEDLDILHQLRKYCYCNN